VTESVCKIIEIVFPVIARNSTFVFKCRSVDIRDVGGKLGARYVVEGSPHSRATASG